MTPRIAICFELQNFTHREKGEVVGIYNESFIINTLGFKAKAFVSFISPAVGAISNV
jgi:hypothetical protein